MFCRDFDQLAMTERIERLVLAGVSPRSRVPPGLVEMISSITCCQVRAVTLASDAARYTRASWRFNVPGLEKGERLRFIFGAETGLLAGLAVLAMEHACALEQTRRQRVMIEQSQSAYVAVPSPNEKQLLEIVGIAKAVHGASHYEIQSDRKPGQVPDEEIDRRAAFQAEKRIPDDDGRRFEKKKGRCELSSFFIRSLSLPGLPFLVR